MLAAPEPELDFLVAIKIVVSSKANYWQPPNKAYSKKSGDIFMKCSNDHHYYHYQRSFLTEKECLHCNTLSNFMGQIC